MNNRPLSREEMAELWICFYNMLTPPHVDDEAYLHDLFERGLRAILPPDLMTETLCAERLAKNNPFTGME